MRKIIVLLVLQVCLGVVGQAQAALDKDSAEAKLGERLFLETRFAQFFAANCGGNFNATLNAGDPVMAVLVKADGTIPGPFAGQSMNCRACHLVGDAAQTPGGGFRTYADFARRSPIPFRIEDGLTLTPRNSPSLVNGLLNLSSKRTLHFDGEFPTITDLIKGTLTGRNFGWLPDESGAALHHIAQVIRRDNGSGQLAQDSGGAYRDVFAASGAVDEEFKIPEQYQLDVMKASDAEILDAVAKLMAVYVHTLQFQVTPGGTFVGSPYDVFLKKNGLPQQPKGRKSDLVYARDLRARLAALSNPQFVTEADGKLANHNGQPFVFGPKEMQGLQIFLSEPMAGNSSASVGNCLACHAPPRFTDFGFHNTGATQEEYDFIHGEGAFMKLAIPSLNDRMQNPDAFLPATAAHPKATGVFRSIPIAGDARQTDLGVWNIFANPDMPTAQKHILASLNLKHADPETVLTRCIGAFKTPGLRDLPDSAPFLHTGRMDTLTDVLHFYQRFSTAARLGAVRNADLEIAKINISEDDVDALEAFLLSLTEDYD